MKFQKFVKSLGSEGIIYVRKNEERWLASGSVFTDPCELHRAVMPDADGAIKDCIRIYATENALNTVAISNPDYTLIEKKDCVEMYVKVNGEEETTEGLALVVKEFENPMEDPVTIGVIFPTEYEG